MKKLRSEKGAITLVVLVSILFMVSFLISTYVIVANKVKTQKEMVEQTRAIYENTGSMEEIYNSYFITGEVIPIYTVEQLLAIGTNKSEVINGKYYNFTNDATYILMNDLEFNAQEYSSLLKEDGRYEWVPIGSLKNTFSGFFKGNGKTIKVTNSDGFQHIYSKNNNYGGECRLDFITLPEDTEIIIYVNGKQTEKVQYYDTVQYIIAKDGYIQVRDEITNILEHTKIEIQLTKEVEYNDNATGIIIGENIVPIPKGFVASPFKDEQGIETGFVIYQLNEGETSIPVTETNETVITRNQFVWIPIDDINGMIMCQTCGDAGELNENLQCTTCLESTKLAGKLYATGTGNSSFNLDLSGQKYSGMKEPANITRTRTIDTETTINGILIPAGTYELDSQEMFTLNDGGTYTNTMYQEEFDKMAKSVATYDGFYIGRYETGGFNQSVVVSKPGRTDIASVCWYKMYRMQKDFAKDSSVIGSSMIWGCQYDQVMKFVNGKKDGNDEIYDVTTSGKRYMEFGTGNSPADKVANIYDLEGNVREWTLEGLPMYRVSRGGFIGNYSSASNRESNGNPYGSWWYVGSRFIIYIK